MLFMTSGTYITMNLIALLANFFHEYGNGNGIYTAHFLYGYVQMRFTIQLRGEIGHQLVKAPMAAAISPFMISPTHPTHEYM